MLVKMSEKSSTKANFRGKIKKICPTTVDELNISQISRFNKKAKKVLSKERDEGSIHLGAEISFLAESFGTVPKLWLRILARKNLPKLLSWNSVPKF